MRRREFIASLGGLAVAVSAEESIAAWLHIGADGQVTVYTGKAEVGQDTRTSLTQAVAEELRVPPASVKLVMADTDVVPFDAGTFGSRSTPFMAPQLRRAAAAARETLLDLAAEKLRAPRETLSIAGGRVGPLGFGELTRGQKLLRTVPSEVKPSAPLAQSIPKVNGEDFVTGRHRFASDVKRPGMLYGRVLRPPAFGAKLVAVHGEHLRDGDLAGVVGATEAEAERKLAALKAEWKTEPQPSSAELFDSIQPPQLRHRYTVAYIAHVPLETRAAVAEWENGKLTVWTGTQRPFGVRTELSKAFGIPESRVRVIVPDTGAGYGGKHTGDAALDAARLAKGAGKPVKVVWTREEEFTWAYFRPAGVIEIAAAVDKGGRITSWEFHNYNSGPAGLRTPYDVSDKREEFHATRAPLRQGSYRALAATANHFARESHMDELAHAAGLDPLEFRLRNTANPRLRGVLEAAAEKFGWGRRKADCGIAAGFEKGSYVATCAEVAVEKGQIRVVRVAEAFDCGAVVNPDHLRNQIEGCIVMGLGGALFEEVQFENGRILNPRLARYRVPRFSDLPAIEIVLLDRKEVPSAGAGETPIVGIAPAAGNAVFSITGQRLRSLPLKLRG